MSVTEQHTQEELFINELVSNIEAGEYDDALAKLLTAVRLRHKAIEKRNAKGLKNHVGETWYINELFPDMIGTPVRIEKAMIKRVKVFALEDNSFCDKNTTIVVPANALSYDDPTV